MNLSIDEDFNIDEIPLDDKKTFELFSTGRMIGVFQLESRIAQITSRSLKPTRFEEIVALVALIRPGPLGANMHIEFADRATGKKEIEFLHKDLKRDIRRNIWCNFISRTSYANCSKNLSIPVR